VSRDGKRTPPDLPRIDGYVVWPGRVLLHARYDGTSAQARQEGRPWHVVAESPELLVEEVNRGR
jgi:hypothetical protein